jgi:uncharacterized protein (TIGR02246 family)
MPRELPAPIAAYIAGSNAHDAGACATCFTDDGVVQDEGRDRRGNAAIRAWMEEVSAKYRPTVDVIDIAETDDKTIVIGRVSGDFPGSPIELRYTFTLAGDKIARLEIRP